MTWQVRPQLRQPKPRGMSALFDQRPGKWLRLSLSAVVCVVAFSFAAWVSLRKSAGFQRQIDALKTLD
jgi:hypothetical protein